MSDNPLTSAQHLVSAGTLGACRRMVTSGPFIVSVTEHTRGFSSHTHVHERASVNIVLAGAYAESLAGEKVLAPAGTVMLKPAWQEHANEFRTAGARCLLIEITPPGQTLIDEAATMFDVAEHRPLRTDLLALQRLEALLRNDDGACGVELEECVYELLLPLARQIHLREERRPDRWLSRVREIIAETMLRAPSLGELAESVNRHPAHVARAFKSRHGCTISTYVRRQRIGRAAHLLRTTSLPVSVIAYDVGFYDHAHLTREFRRVAGVTPTAYRGRRDD